MLLSKHADETETQQHEDILHPNANTWTSLVCKWQREESVNNTQIQTWNYHISKRFRSPIWPNQIFPVIALQKLLIATFEKEIIWCNTRWKHCLNWSWEFQFPSIGITQSICTNFQFIIYIEISRVNKHIVPKMTYYFNPWTPWHFIVFFNSSVTKCGLQVYKNR